jgi:rhamnulokinase
MSLAASAPPFTALINPDDPRFVGPGEMPQKIAAYCRETGQTPPQSPGETVRCVLESLALLYRRTFRQLEQLTGTHIPRLHIVGGGSRNELLNQSTANALGARVFAGPVEATALGNVLVQAITCGDLKSLSAARELVANSFAVTCYEPAPSQQPAWDSAAARFAVLP